MATNTKEFKAKNIRCKDCNKTFVFGTGEQAFFWSKGMPDPKRCKECRLKRKQTLLRRRADEEG